MSTKGKAGKILLGVLAAVAIFSGCLAFLSIAGTNAVDHQSLQIQRSNNAFMGSDINIDQNVEQRFLSAQKFTTAVNLPLTWAYQPTLVTASTASNFIDVKQSDWFYNEVQWAIDQQITNGVGNNSFAPNQTCTNAQILTFIWRAYGEPQSTEPNPFTDVTPANYYYQAALWAYENELVAGAIFSPDKDCTRTMVVDYLWKAAGSPSAFITAQFDDVPSYLSSSKAISWAVENKITTGVSGKLFAPNDTCTRAQIVTFLYRNDQYLNTVRNTVTSSSGATYTGVLQNGQPHGKGVLIIPNVGQYDGNFENGKRNGSGTFTWVAGGSYSGSWSDDRINGNGNLTTVSGDILSGIFTNGRLTTGTYTFAQSFGKMEVPVSGGELQLAAEVTITLLDGSVYSGFITNGKLNGTCVISFANGDKYSGQVVNNQKSGTGIYTWKNGAWYDGSWFEDEMSGQGVYYYTSSAVGERLLGTFSHNAPINTCIYYSAANIQYSTVWYGGRCTSVERS